MSCPTCSGTMQNIGAYEGPTTYWCKRCGTIRMKSGAHVSDEAPALVERCREFIRMIDPVSPAGRWLKEQCHISGVAESALPPEKRPT